MRGNPLFVQKAGFPRTPSGKNSNIFKVNWEWADQSCASKRSCHRFMASSQPYRSFWKRGAGPLGVGPTCILRLRAFDTHRCPMMHDRRARSTFLEKNVGHRPTYLKRASLWAYRSVVPTASHVRSFWKRGAGRNFFAKKLLPASSLRILLPPSFPSSRSYLFCSTNSRIVDSGMAPSRTILRALVCKFHHC